jgi:hypothetical protein
MPKFKVGDIIKVTDEGSLLSNRSWIVEEVTSSRYIVRYKNSGKTSPTTGTSSIIDLDRICHKVGSTNKDEITVSSATYLDRNDITSEDKDVISKALEYYPHES